MAFHEGIYCNIFSFSQKKLFYVIPLDFTIFISIFVYIVGAEKTHQLKVLPLDDEYYYLSNFSLPIC